MSTNGAYQALNSFTHLFTNFDYLKITDDQKH